MPDWSREGLYEEGDYWEGFDGYASGEFDADEPPVKIPEGPNKLIIASAVGLLGLGLAAGAVIATKHVINKKSKE